MRPSGVGLVFTRRLFSLARAEIEAVSTLEIEPQTLWQLSRAGDRQAYVGNRERMDELAALPSQKLLHSIGLPVGGSCPQERKQLDLLAATVRVFQPAWVSEHLSFNAFPDGASWSSAGFLLPPLQCPETVAIAADHLRALADVLECPVAFETGVNYLRPQPAEMNDGDFFEAVAEAADCGILLDLHNLWANELNGRSTVDEVLRRIPLERIWEIHFAGGMSLDGYWLDAHSGPTPAEVLQIARRWIPRMPNLGALVFEILDEHVEGLGIDGIRKELEALRSLWALRSPVSEIGVRMPAVRPAGIARVELEAVRTWENTLGSLAIGRVPSGEISGALRGDGGVGILRKLVADARAGLISEGLRYSTTLLLCSLGGARVREILTAFMRTRPPELFASAEADAFANFLRQLSLPVAYLSEVLAFEHALVRAMLYGEGNTVTFTHDPVALFESLDEGRLPGELPQRPASFIVESA